MILAAAMWPAQWVMIPSRREANDLPKYSSRMSSEAHIGRRWPVRRLDGLQPIFSRFSAKRR